ncbi:MAG: AraC family transcriptional regulator [Clostridium sp.]
MNWTYSITEDTDQLPMKMLLLSTHDIITNWHSEFEIILVLNGSIHVTIDNETHRVKEDELMFISSNRLHRFTELSNDNIVLILQVDREYFSRYYGFNEKMIINYREILNKENLDDCFRDIRYHIAKIFKIIVEKEYGYKLLVGSELNILLYYMACNFRDNIIFEGDYRDYNKEYIRIKRIIEYINSGESSLKHIADKEKLSKCYLSHYIKEKIGISFQECVSATRMNRAISLLMKTEDTITSIALESGFPNTKIFNKKFKDIYGCCPRDFRRKNSMIIRDKEDHIKDYKSLDKELITKKIEEYIKAIN